MAEKKFSPTTQESNDFWKLETPKEDIEQYDESLDDSYNEPISSDGISVPTSGSSEMWSKNYNPQEEGAMQDATTSWQRPGGEYLLEPENSNIDYDMGLIEMAGKSFVVGLGDMVDSWGDAVDFISGSSSSEVSKQVYGVDTSKPISDMFHNFGDYLQSYGDDVPHLADLESVTWDDLTEPEFWATGVARMLPFALSLLVPATGVARGVTLATKGAKLTKATKAVMKGAKSIGATKFTTELAARGLVKTGLATTAAGATSNFLEGVSLAGQTLNEGVKQGLTESEAHNAASLVFRDNLASMAADIVQYGLFMGQMGVGKGVLAGAEKLGVKVGATKVGQTAAGAVGKAGEKLGAAGMKAPGMKEVIQNSFKAIGMGAIHGVTDGVVEQFQEVYQDWSVQRRIAEKKGEDFPDYLDFFLAKEQLPTRVLSFATSLLMSGTSNTIRTATENRAHLQRSIDDRNESHEMLDIFYNDLDNGEYKVKKTVKVNKKDADGNIMTDAHGRPLTETKEIVETLNAEDASNWGRDSAAHTMISNAVSQGDESVVMEFFDAQLEAGTISEEQHNIYKQTLDSVSQSMEGKPTHNLNNKEKSRLVAASWLHNTSKVKLEEQKELIQAQVDSILEQVESGALKEDTAKEEIAGLKALAETSLQAQEDIKNATKEEIDSIYVESQTREKNEKWEKEVGSEVDSLIAKELGGETLTAEEQAFLDKDERAKSRYDSGLVEGKFGKAKEAASKKLGKKFKGHELAKVNKDGSYEFTKKNLSDGSLSIVTVDKDGNVEQKTDRIDETLDKVDKDLSEKEKDKEEKVEEKVDEAKVDVTEKNNSVDKKLVTPAALKEANEKGIDLELVEGTGTNGRIVKADVQNYTPSEETKTEEEEKKTKLPDYLKGGNLKASAELVYKAGKTVVKAFFSKRNAVKIIDAAEAAIHRRKMRRAFRFGQGSERTLANLYAKKSADGLISVQFLDEIYSRDEASVAYALGLGIFVDSDAPEDSPQEAIFHENFHIFRMLYGHLKEVKKMMSAVVGQPVYKITKLDYQEDLLYALKKNNGEEVIATQEEILNILKIQQTASGQQSLFEIITNVEDYAFLNNKQLNDKTREEFYKYSLDILNQAGYAELKPKHQVHIQDEALAKLGGLYGSVNQDMYIAGQGKEEYNGALKSWKEKIQGSITKEEGETAFEIASKGLYKAKGKVSLEEQFAMVKDIVAKGEKKYGAYATTPRAHQKKLLKRSAVLKDATERLNNPGGIAHQRAKDFYTNEAKTILKDYKDLTEDEIRQRINAKLSMSSSVNVTFSELAREILGQYRHGSKDYNDALRALRDKAQAIKNAIESQHKTGLTQEMQRILGNARKEKEMDAFYSALEGNLKETHTKLEEAILYEDEDGNIVEADEDSWADLLSDKPQQMSGRLYSLIEEFLQKERAGQVEVSKDSLLYAVKGYVLRNRGVNNFIEAANRDIKRVQSIDGDNRAAVDFFNFLKHEHDFGGAGNVLGGLYLQVNSMVTEKAMVITNDGFVPVISLQDESKIGRILNKSGYIAQDFIARDSNEFAIFKTLWTKRFLEKQPAKIQRSFRKRIEYIQSLGRLLFKGDLSKEQKDQYLLEFINTFIKPKDLEFTFTKESLDELYVYNADTAKSLPLREYLNDNVLMQMFKDSISVDVKKENLKDESFKKYYDNTLKALVTRGTFPDGINLGRGLEAELNKEELAKMDSFFYEAIDNSYLEVLPQERAQNIKYVSIDLNGTLLSSSIGKPSHSELIQVLGFDTVQEMDLVELTDEQAEAAVKDLGFSSVEEYHSENVSEGKIYQYKVKKNFNLTKKKASISMFESSSKDNTIEPSAAFTDMVGVKAHTRNIIAAHVAEYSNSYSASMTTPSGNNLNLTARKYYLEYNKDALNELLDKNSEVFTELFTEGDVMNPYANGMADGSYTLNFVSLNGSEKHYVDRDKLTNEQVTIEDVKEIREKMNSSADTYKQVVRDYSDKSRRYYANATIYKPKKSYKKWYDDITKKLDKGGKGIKNSLIVLINEELKRQAYNSIPENKIKKPISPALVKAYIEENNKVLISGIKRIKKFQDAYTQRLVDNHNNKDHVFNLHLVSSPETIERLRKEGYKITTPANKDSETKVKGELNLLGDALFDQTINGELRSILDVDTHILIGQELLHENDGDVAANAAASMNYFVNKIWLQNLTSTLAEEQNFSTKNKRSTGLIAPHDSLFDGERVETIIFEDINLKPSDQAQTVQVLIDGKLVEKELTPILADSASYVTQETADRIMSKYGGVADVKGSFKLVGYGRNTDNARIAEYMGGKSSQFYFKGHTIILNSKVKGPLAKIYNSLKIREEYYNLNKIQGHNVIAYSHEGVKKGGLNQVTLSQLNDPNFKINEFMDSWSWDKDNNVRGYDGRFFGVQNELDKDSNTATIAKQGISNVNVFADHKNPEIANQANTVLALYAAALDMQYEEKIEGKLLKDLALEDVNADSMPVIEKVSLLEGITDLPGMRRRITEQVDTKIRKGAFKGRTKGTLSIQESDLVQGYRFNKDNELVETDNSLAPLSVSEKEGKFIVNHPEAIISKHAAQLLGIKKEDLDKNGNVKEGKEFFMIATRIPASSAGSTLVLKVKGVSPKPGNTIAVNAKTSHIIGSDLDGDMLHLNFLEVASEGKELTELQQAKNDVIQAIIDLYSIPETASMLAQIIEFETITNLSNKALYGSEKGNPEVYNDFNILGADKIFETTKGNVPMIGNIAAQNLTYNYLSQGNPKIYYQGEAISFVGEKSIGKDQNGKLKELEHLSNTINSDGTGTYYELCNYLNLILDDGKNTNRANFQFIENTASSFIMLIKFGVKPHMISSLLKQVNWAQYKDMKSSDVSEMANTAMYGIWLAQTGSAEENTPSFMEMVQEVYGGVKDIDGYDGIRFNLDEIINSEEGGLVLYQIMKDIGNDIFDLGLYSGLDKHFTTQGVSNLLKHHKAVDALKNQPGIADNVMANNAFIKRNKALNYELIQKSLSENPDLTNGYQAGLIGKFDEDGFSPESSGLLNVEIEEGPEGPIPRFLFRQKFGDKSITSDETSANKMVSAINLARVMLHSDYNIKENMFDIINSFKVKNKYSSEQWNEMSDLRKLENLNTEVANMLIDMQNVGLFDGHIWLDPNEGILKIRRVKHLVNLSRKPVRQADGKMKMVDKPHTIESYKFTLDTAALVNVLEFPEQVDLFRKSFASIDKIIAEASAKKGNTFTPKIQDFLVLNDLLSTGWGAKEGSSSAVPYMSKEESKKINNYFKKAQEKGNFDDDFKAMGDKIHTLKRKTSTGEDIPAPVMNRRIATLAYLSLHDVGTLVYNEKGKPSYRNEFGHSLVSVYQKPLGSDARNNEAIIFDGHKSIKRYQEQGMKDKSDGYVFDGFGEGMSFYNSHPEFNMLQVFGMISNKDISAVGVIEHEVSVSPQQSSGVEISSNVKGLAAALTNPTELAKSKGNLVQSYSIEFNGNTYKDVEQAYQKLKDKSEAKTKPTKGNSNNYKLMVDLIKAKLQQHPRLVSEITKKGGSAWISSSTHQPTKQNTVWETGGQNWFIESLADAYNALQPGQQSIESLRQEAIKSLYSPTLLNGDIAPHVQTDLIISKKNDKPKTWFGESSAIKDINSGKYDDQLINVKPTQQGGKAKKKYLKISTRGGKDFGAIGVPLSKTEYLNRVNPDMKYSELTAEEKRIVDNRFKAYEESVKKVKELYNESSKTLNDSSYKYSSEKGNMSELDDKFNNAQNVYGGIYDDLRTLEVKDNDGNLHLLDPIAAYSLRKYMEYSFGNHIAEKQIADWEKAHGRSFVETITDDVRKKDISYAKLLMSPGDFGKSKPAIAYINKNLKMTHMRFTRNMALVTTEMNEKLDALYKEKFGEGFKSKAIRKWMNYMPMGSMTYSQILFGSFFSHETGVKKEVKNDGSVKWRDTSNLQLKRSLFTTIGGKGGELILKDDSILLKPKKNGGQGLTEAELDYLKMYTKYTGFYRQMITEKKLHDGNRGGSYLPNVASGSWETYHRRGMFGMYYQLLKGDDTIAEVVVEGYNPITGETDKLDYFSWKAIFMHAPGEKFVKVAPVKTKRGVSLQTTSEESLQTMTGPERIKAFEAIKSRAKELYEIGTDDADNPIQVESNVNQALELEIDESVNRFTSSRSMGAAYIATHNMHLALREYTRKMMFQHGNSFFSQKNKAWHALSIGGNDKALEHRKDLTAEDMKSSNLLFTGFEDKMPFVDAAIANVGNNDHAVKYLQKVVKGGLIQQTRNLTHTESPIKMLGQEPEKVIINFFTQWTMYIALGFNVPAAVGNVAIGKWNALRQAGGKKLVVGESRYWGVGQDKVYSNSKRVKARKMIDYFGILTYRAEELAEGVGGNSLSSLIFYPMVAAENWIQQAQFLGNIPQEKYDAYTVDSNGDVQFMGDMLDEKGNPLYPEVTEDLRITQEQVANMERDVINVQGRGYSETDIRYVQLYSFGNMCMQFKRWFPTFLADRLKQEDVDDLGNMRIGSLVAANEFINKMYKEGKVWNGQIFKEIKNIPEDHKRDAVYRVWHGTKGMMVIALLYALAKQSQDDDEPEDETTKMLEKLLGDIFLLGNVPKLTYMANIPAVETMKNLSLALTHSVARTEYQRKAKYGDKGDLKATAHFARLLPKVLRKPLELKDNNKKRSLR